MTNILNSADSVSAVEKDKRIQQLSKALEDSKKLIDILLENQSKEKEILKQEKVHPISTPPLTFESNEIGKISGGFISETRLTNQGQIPININSKKIQMTSKEFFLYHSLQEKQAADRVRQAEKDAAERMYWYQHMMSHD